MRLISKFNRRHDQQIRVTLSKFHGKEYIDIRVFYEDENGSYLPTKKGVTVPKNCYQELKDAIRKLGEHCEDE